MYKVYDHVVYGHMEPAVPFSVIFESENLNEVREYIDGLNTERYIYFVIKDNKIIFDTTQKIYESPDGGKTVYERIALSEKKEKV